MWTCASCDAENSDMSEICHECAVVRDVPVEPDSGPTLDYATVGRRYGANFPDYVAAFAVSTVAMIVDFNGNGDWLDVLLPNVMDDSFRSGVFLVVIYFAILLLSTQLFGQTLGKVLLGLRVVDESGVPATARQKMKYELLAPF